MSLVAQGCLDVPLRPYRYQKTIDQAYDEQARLDTDDVNDVKILVEVIAGVLHDHYGKLSPPRASLIHAAAA